MKRGFVSRLSIVIVLLSLLMALIPVSVVNADTVVNFPDPNLEAAVRQAIGKPTGPILQSDLDRINNVFNARYIGIKNISGIEKLTNMKTLWIDGNQISDISPLATLTGLQGLYLNSNQISNISPLTGLIGLLTCPQ